MATYEYDIKYKKTSQHGNADGLSRLPLTEPDEEQSEVPTEVVLLVEAMTNDLCSDTEVDQARSSAVYM